VLTSIDPSQTGGLLAHLDAMGHSDPVVLGVVR
jgi:L-fucose mutarotase/ribose pyranase (RbsD/FucU family)